VATFFLPNLQVRSASSKHSHIEKKREQGLVGGKNKGAYLRTPLHYKDKKWQAIQ